MLEAVADVGTVVLLSGDGDFDRLLTHPRTRHGVTAEVSGVRELTAKSLVEPADVFHPVSEDLLIYIPKTLNIPSAILLEANCAR